MGLLFVVFQSDLTLERAMFSFLFIVSIISFLLYSLEHFMAKLEVVMFPRKFYLQSALKKISNDLSSIKSFRELKELILLNIVNTIQVSGGAIVFQYNNDIEIIDEGDIDHNQIKMAIQSPNDSDYTVYEINRHEEYTSYLVLTAKKTNTFIGQEETQWLDVVLSNLGISLENLYLIRRLNLRLHELASQLPNEQEGSNLIWFRKTMFDLQEKERIRIAADLHDTTMQDIFFIQRKLRVYQRQVLGMEDNKQLDDILYHLDLVNGNLRQNCFELNPPILASTGFLKAVKGWIDIESAACLFKLSFFTDEDERIELKDMETKRHLFRVVQELINNAKKHSKASIVTISCTSSDTHFYLEYQDNGIGFEIPRAAANRTRQSGIGIEQMKSRILEIQGNFAMQSTQGQGLKIEVSIPLMQEEMIS